MKLEKIIKLESSLLDGTSQWIFLYETCESCMKQRKMLSEIKKGACKVLKRKINPI
jgi:hypothetical protein